MTRIQPHSDEMGPTWQDVYDYVHRLEIMWSCTVLLQMRLHMSGKPERLCGTCTALAYHPTQVGQTPLKTGYHGFKGQAGAKTAPGAYWHALSDLEGRLAGIDKVRQDRLDL